jgi:hypothetical protein
MGILEKILKRKKEETEIALSSETKLPEELEKFKVTPSPPLPTKEPSFTERHEEHGILEFPPIGKDIALGEKREEQKEVDKLDLILARLETINERLKVIEEKLERRGF